MNRFERQVSFFGEEGQRRLRQVKVAIIGLGGLGSHVAQQLAFLGIQTITVIDDDKLSYSNTNRLIGFLSTDKPGVPKVDMAERLIKSIDPTIRVHKVENPVNSKDAFEELKKVEFVFGCIDNDGARLFLNEFCLAYQKPYIDLASEIKENNTEYGGRVIGVTDQPGCLYCIGDISLSEASKYLATPEARYDQDLIYGIERASLPNSGPSVVTINGIIASLATTEFLVHITGLRPANRKLTYYGLSGIVRKSADVPPVDCYYCNVVKDSGDAAKLDRYFKY